MQSTASELILEWGIGEARPEGIGFFGRGQPAPPHQLGGLRKRCKLLSAVSGVRGRAPAAEGFSCILSHQIAFPSTGVHV